MESIRVQPQNVWGYFQANKADLTYRGVMKLIASNDDYGSAIYVSEDDGLPQLVVMMDDDIVAQETVCTVAECEKTAKELYDKYLTENAISAFLDNLTVVDDDNEDPDGPGGVDADIRDRERELSDAITEFLGVVLGMDYKNETIDSVADDVLEHTLEYLHRKHGMDFYRPMYLEDEKGVKFFEEYPYGCMIFDDPDNPLYKT